MFDDRGAIKVAKTNPKVDLARRNAEVGWVYSKVGCAIAYVCETIQNSPNIFHHVNVMFDRYKEGNYNV